MRSVVEIGASVPAFLGKLWKLVNDSETNHLISWSPGGKTFVIKNQADFARELLPLYYKHNNMASFIRQLNMYGFHKITSVENGGLRYEKDEIEFSHPCFMKGHAYLLEHIKRKIANSKAIVASNENGDKMIVKPELMNKVLADVKQMKGKQESLDAKFSAMKQENEALWREVAILRQKHIKQQQIVNNLIQFLMSLVQPARPGPNGGGNNAGVKRPYQLMINSAAHNSKDSSYSTTLKNMKIDKDVLDDLNEDNMEEDGPTIHELAHDDALHNEASQESFHPAAFVSVDLANSPNISNANNSADPLTSTQYHVTLEDGDDTETGLPVMEQVINNVITPSASTSKPKTRSASKNVSTNHKSLLSPSSFNSMNPSADFKLPAEIFASDDSVSDTGVNVPEDITSLQESILGGDQTLSTSKDKMLGGINIKVEKPTEFVKTGKKSKKSKDNSNTCNLNLADIKTELQDDFDWNQMTLATINNNTNRLQTVNDIDDHLDTMQTDLESLRELLRSDTYAVDTNTLLGLFGSDDPFYGLSYNALDDRNKTCNNAEENQLISYTGNIPDFEDISIPDFEGENSQEACLSPSPSPSSATLNTPQVELRSPHYSVRP